MGFFLSLEGISKHFGGVRALEGVSLNIQAGEIHCLAGENGSGKSTLIKIVSGIYRPGEGKIITGGREYSHLTPIESIRLGIQVIYQDLSLFPNLTVAENLALNRQLEHRKIFVNWSSVRKTARRSLESLGVDMDLRQLVGELPVAQKQIVAIGRALLHDARLIIMDEPTTALTEVEVEALFDRIRKLKERGVAILFVSHKLREMLKISDRFTILRNGEVAAGGPAGDFDESKITFHMTGRQLRGIGGPPPEAREKRSLLEVRGLSGAIIRDVGFELHRGEILGITGLLGSGQTELALALFGVQPCRRGEVFLRGERRRIRSVQDALSAGIAHVPEDRLREGLFLDQSVEMNTIAANLRPLRNRLGLILPSRVRELVSRRLEQLAVLTPSSRIPVRALSGGNQQRVVLAKWLSRDPDILILNGPTAGIDVASKEGIHQMLRGLAARGMGILLLSDDLPELAANCRRILILHQGRITRELMDEECSEDTIARHLTRLS